MSSVLHVSGSDNLDGLSLILSPVQPIISVNSPPVSSRQTKCFCLVFSLSNALILGYFQSIEIRPDFEVIKPLLKHLSTSAAHPRMCRGMVTKLKCAVGRT